MRGVHRRPGGVDPVDAGPPGHHANHQPRYDCYLGIDHMEGIDGRDRERIASCGGSFW